MLSNMHTTNRVTKSFSLDRRILKEVERTKGGSSTSERVNQLLLLALKAERNQSLVLEAEAFFDQEDDPHARRAFQRASIRAISRDED